MAKVKIQLDRNKPFLNLDNIGKVITDTIYIEPLIEGYKMCTPTESEQIIEPSGTMLGLARVVVRPIPDQYVAPSGTLNIGTNGVFDVTDKKKVNVDVSMLEATTDAEMEALLTEDYGGRLVTFTGETGTYENGGLYLIEDTVKKYKVTLNVTNDYSADISYEVLAGEETLIESNESGQWVFKVASGTVISVYVSATSISTTLVVGDYNNTSDYGHYVNDVVINEDTTITLTVT